jgi:hypothetical protein
LVVVMAAGVGVALRSDTGGHRQEAGGLGAPGHHRLARRDGVLVLALSGTVTSSTPGADAAHGVLGVASPSFNGAAPGQVAGGGSAVANGAASTSTVPSSGPIDVAPTSPSSPSLQRLYGHTSPDGVQMTAFDQPGAQASSNPPSTEVAPAGPVPAVPSGCLTTTELTLEISDVAAVGTVTEPLFTGATGLLVDVQIGEIGNAEGEPATWVMAQVGSAASTVEVQFADGTVDQAAAPPSGLVVLGHKGAPEAALGNGSVAALDVLGSGGQVLAAYGLGVASSVPSSGSAPTGLPAPGAVQPADVAAATAAVTRAAETALGCSASPIQRLQATALGDAVESLPTLGGSAGVSVDEVVFTSDSTAVVQYHLDAASGAVGPLYAAATLARSTWQLSVASVAPGIQMTPANQVGNVTVAPGGPLFVHSWPGGTAVALYKALPGSQAASSGYGAGQPACTPAGGVVEEVTTPGAVAVLTSALFPNYPTALISAAVSTVGSAEGAPATVVGVEVGSQAASVSVTDSGGTVQESPVDGSAVIVLAGDPSTVLGGSGSELQVSDASGATQASVSLQVDASAPAGPASLPATLPAPGSGPADPQAATQAITSAFESVFDCATPPIQRVQAIQDGSLVAGALEQLDTGPYEALASSSYIDVTQVVFENPTLADVSYTLRFHSDAGLTFPMIGQAVIVAGSWRVSYATVCAAVQLGLGTCQT